MRCGARCGVGAGGHTKRCEVRDGGWEGLVTSRAGEVNEKQPVLGAQRLGLNEWVQVGPRARQACNRLGVGVGVDLGVGKG